LNIFHIIPRRRWIHRIILVRQFFFSHKWAIIKREWNERLKGPRVPKKSQFTHERVEYVFCSTRPLKAPNGFKSLKLAWRFVLTSCDIYQNPFTQEKILKFWQCRTKNNIIIDNSTWRNQEQGINNNSY
jgi:hypothetical protein